MMRRLCSLIFILVNLTKSILFSETYPHPEAAINISQKCRDNCNSHYGSVIGINNRVKAYSNCDSEDCINYEDPGVIFKKEDSNLVRDVYVGMRWQCVEYARRWLIVNKNVLFGEIDSAFEIFDLNHVEDLTSLGRKFDFISYSNSNTTPPKFGDLLIYPKAEDAPYGHVAVVTNVNLELGYVEIAEQNYYNKLWEEPESYARRVVLLKSPENKYVVTEILWRSESRYDDFNQLCIIESNSVIGFKRILEI